MDTLLIFFLNRSFLDIVEKNHKPVFKIRQSLPILYINLKWRAIFQIYRLFRYNSDWLNFIHFSGYKYQIKLVSILRKSEDQALISISTIIKFSALINELKNRVKIKCHHNVKICSKPEFHGMHCSSQILLST